MTEPARQRRGRAIAMTDPEVDEFLSARLAQAHPGQAGQLGLPQIRGSVRVISYQLYIDGRWTGSDGDSVLTVLNPATEEAVGTVPEGTVSDINRAVAAARRAFDEGPYRIGARIRAGLVYINGGGAGSSPHTPFGGYKSSGLGVERGEYGLEEFLLTKSMIWSAANRGTSHARNGRKVNIVASGSRSAGVAVKRWAPQHGS